MRVTEMLLSKKLLNNLPFNSVYCGGTTIFYVVLDSRLNYALIKCVCMCDLKKRARAPNFSFKLIFTQIQFNFREGNHPDDFSRLTYRKLLEEVCRFSNVLKSHGVKKGDRVAIYMPMVLELPIAMLACNRIGAVHSIVVSVPANK